MKTEIHPKYNTVNVSCVCGAVFQTGSTIKEKEIKVGICSQCHPFYTGKAKFIDTAGRLERFKNKYGDSYKNKDKKKGAESSDKPAETEKPKAQQ